MTYKKEAVQGERAASELSPMEPLIERIHENADHLCELMDGVWPGFEQRRLKSVGFLIRLMKEDALNLYALYTQASKTEP